MAIKQMKNTLIAGAATLVALQASAISTLANSGTSTAGLKFSGDVDKGQGVKAGIRGTDTDFSNAVQNIITYLTYFLYVVAVVFALWGGFQILTAAGDEEKVKKGKTILIQAGIGLFVIFIASSLVKFIIKAISAASSGQANDGVVQIIHALI